MSNRNQMIPALIPLLVLVFLLFFVIRIFGPDALDGASQAALIISSGVGIAIALAWLKVPWQRIEDSIGNNFRNIATAIIILLMVGAIGGTWMVSGIVPTLIIYGLRIIHPAVFLFAACFICALVSVMTGSSWTTIATVGLALIAIGTALGYSPALSAGAIISGAYFGDKVSPLSDTTVLASSMCGVPLFDHIRYMMRTTGPAFIIALAAYLVISLCHGADGSVDAQVLEQVLRSKFNISPWLLVVPVLTGIMIWRRVPAFLTLLCASVMAAVAAHVFQPGLVAEVSGTSGALTAASGFRGVIQMLALPTGLLTGSPDVDALVQTGGMSGMLPTVFLIACAATFGGVLEGSGMIETLTDALTRHISSRPGIVAGTMATGLSANAMTGDQYLSIVLTSRVFRSLYERLGYEDRLLSRSVEDSVTVTSVLVPWNTCGLTQATVLHVATAAYLPFCFFNILSPLISLFDAFLRAGKK